MAYNSYGIKRARTSPKTTPPPSGAAPNSDKGTNNMVSLASEFDYEDNEALGDFESPVVDQVKLLEERLAKMEAWQAAVTPTDPDARVKGKKVIE